METYLQTHPWLTFTMDTRQFHFSTWVLLGEAVSKCEHVAGSLLSPELADNLMKVYLAKGALATTAIEGNTLNEDEARQLVEGSLRLPQSKEYLGIEIDNIVRTSNALLSAYKNATFPDRFSPDFICQLNFDVLAGLSVEDHVTPGVYRSVSVGVADYRGAPAKDISILMQRLCDWINQPWILPTAMYGQHESKRLEAIIKSVIAHLYLAWIHPFGDGNGRTARLMEFSILLRAGCPFPTAHLLSNHYNETRSDYYKQLSYASKSGGDVTRFIAYAVRGFVDQIRQQITYIRDTQHDIFWQHYLHKILGDSDTGRRRRYLVMDLAENYPQGIDKTKLRETSVRVYKNYIRHDDHTVSLDVQELTRLQILVQDADQIKANKDIVLAFLPEQQALQVKLAEALKTSSSNIDQCN
jgi:Fic family protein